MKRLTGGSSGVMIGLPRAELVRHAPLGLTGGTANAGRLRQGATSVGMAIAQTV
jgi:hypothetical protein